MAPCMAKVVIMLRILRRGAYLGYPNGPSVITVVCMRERQSKTYREVPERRRHEDRGSGRSDAASKARNADSHRKPEEQE